MKQGYKLLIAAATTAVALFFVVMVFGYRNNRKDTPQENKPHPSLALSTMSQQSPAVSFEPTSDRIEPARVNPQDAKTMIASVQRIARCFSTKQDQKFSLALQQVLIQYLPPNATISSDTGDNSEPSSETDSILMLIGESRDVIQHAKRANDPVAQLAQDLLVVVAQESPSGVGRMMASQTLTTFATPDSEEKRFFTVDADKAAIAIDRSIHFVLDNAIRGDADTKTALSLFRNQGLLSIWMVLRVSQNPSQANQILAQDIADIKDKLSNAVSATHDKAVRQILEDLQQDLQELSNKSKEYTTMANRQERLYACVKGFLDEVNRENKAAASNFLTDKTAASLKSISSLRSAVSGISHAKEIHLKELGPLRNVGDKIEVALYVDVVDDTDSTKNKVINVSIVEVDNAYRIGDK
jgi:hypothetical protein